MKILNFTMQIGQKNSADIFRGFTMAEVLITLAVIGIVASMTLPALINKIHLTQYIAQLKSDYSILAQAHSQIIADYDTFQSGIMHCESQPAGLMRNNCFRDVFATKIKSIRTCEEPYILNDVKSSCFADFNKVKLLNGQSATSNYLNYNASTMLLPNGSALLFFLDDASCDFDWGGQFNYKRCGWITLDVNGAKNPNKFGIDIYVLYVMNEAVRPLAYEYMAESNKNGDCTPQSNGYSCSSHYILK